MVRDGAWGMEWDAPPVHHPFMVKLTTTPRKVTARLGMSDTAEAGSCSRRVLSLNLRQ